MFQRRAMVRQIFLEHKALDLFAWCWKHHNGAFDNKLIVAIRETLHHQASDKELSDLLHDVGKPAPKEEKT